MPATPPPADYLERYELAPSPGAVRLTLTLDSGEAWTCTVHPALGRLLSDDLLSSCAKAAPRRSEGEP